ncbi:MAG: hypothetical protein KAS75_03765 [Planctomycetes bacterium]|nr:hypothetical protein [Planctomycetota bacterium]
MKHTSYKTFYILLSIFCFSVSLHAKTLPDTAKLVPPETVLLVNINDFNQLKQQFEKTSIYKLYKDPTMAAFVNDAKAKWLKKIQELDENDIFKSLFDTNILPNGRVAIALVLNKQAKDFNEPPILFITQWGENITKIKESVNKLNEKNTELGGHQKGSENYHNVKVETMIDEGSSVFCYCFIDDYFIGTMDIDLLKFVIAHISGASSPTLASSSDYVTTTKAVGPYHDIDFYVNIKQILKTITTEDSTGKTQVMMSNLGIDNATALSGSFGLGRTPGNSFGSKVFLKVDGSKKGILKMLETESKALQVPRFIPSSVYSAIFLNLDIKKAYNELYNILYSFSPMQAAKMHMPLLPPNPDGQPGLQLKTDVIDHLGSQIIIAQSVNKPFSSTTPSESLIALAANNSKALEKSLSLFHSIMIAPNNPDAKRELLGHTIYLLSMKGLPFFGRGPTPTQGPIGPVAQPMPTFAFSFTDNYMILGFESTVEKAIRTLNNSSDTSIASVKWFNNAKSTIPSAVGMAELQNNEASSEALWWMVKQGHNVQGSNIAPNIAPQSINQLVDFSLLPEFDIVRKYFGTSASYGISRNDGFFFEFKCLDPGITD